MVQHASDSWWSDTASPDYLVFGADSSIPSNPGDSGSPVYRLVNGPVGEPDWIYGIGILVHEGGFFARLPDALSGLGAQLYEVGDP